MDWSQIIITAIGSSSLTSGAVAIVMKLIDRKSITRRTLAHAYLQHIV